jgi:transposase
VATTKRRYELSDEEWDRIKDYIPSNKQKKQGRPAKDNRLMMNAILWIARSGAPWRDLPERYGPWETVYTRFKNWDENHVFDDIFAMLSIDADYQDLSLDSTSIKAHEHSAGAKKGQ